MTSTQPQAHLDQRFSSPDAEPIPWADARDVLSGAGVYWISTVQKDGTPHVTPVAGVWLGDALYFSTGPGEQKALNLARNPRCSVTVGQSGFWNGLDVVLQGEVRRVADETLLQSLAREFERKYRGFFGFTAGDGYFLNAAGGIALVYRIEAEKRFGFTRGETFSQTRWRFDHETPSPETAPDHDALTDTGNRSMEPEHFNTELPSGLSRPAQRALADAGIQRLHDLTRFTSKEIERLHGMGPKAMRQLREALAETGLSFAGTEHR